MHLTEKRVHELRKVKRFAHWLDQYALIELFREKYNRFPKSKEKYPVGNNLGRWFNDSNKSAYRKGYLKRWQVYLLNKINYVFEPPNRWENNYAALKKGWGRHPESWPYVYYYTPNLKRVEMWCKQQRYYYKNGRLSSDKIKKLNAINFTWMPPGKVCWENHYNNVRKWIRKNKRLPCRSSTDRKEKFYIMWLAKERSKINKGKLSEERATKIESLCKIINYDPMRIGWDKILKSYWEWFIKYGQRPKKYSKNVFESKLGQWIVTQNTLLHTGKMPKERIPKFKMLKTVVKFPEKRTI
jgi:hypothetical protein